MNFWRNRMYKWTKINSFGKSPFIVLRDLWDSRFQDSPLRPGPGPCERRRLSSTPSSRLRTRAGAKHTQATAAKILAPPSLYNELHIVIKHKPKPRNQRDWTTRADVQVGPCLNPPRSYSATWLFSPLFSRGNLGVPVHHYFTRVL